MTKITIKLLDVVALTVDLPEYNLYRGQVGTVVELLAGGAAFEVEFSDACGGLRLRNGRTYESVGLRSEQIMVLHFEPASPDSVRPDSISCCAQSDAYGWLRLRSLIKYSEIKLYL